MTISARACRSRRSCAPPASPTCSNWSCGTGYRPPRPHRHRHRNRHIRRGTSVNPPPSPGTSHPADTVLAELIALGEDLRFDADRLRLRGAATAAALTPELRGRVGEHRDALRERL